MGLGLSQEVSTEPPGSRAPAGSRAAGHRLPEKLGRPLDASSAMTPQKGPSDRTCAQDWGVGGLQGELGVCELQRGLLGRHCWPCLRVLCMKVFGVSVVSAGEGTYRSSRASKPDLCGQCREGRPRGGMDGPWRLRPQRRELSGRRAGPTAPSDRSRALWAASSVPPPSILPLGPNRDTQHPA